jgi:glycosyltransferase involved in cell wall biosynthesis
MAKLTVLMTVYNGQEFLRETVESILNQTYKDFVFLILDNASTDNSCEIIRSYDDPRIRLEALPQNIGQIPALNKGLDMIDTPLVARMDADDISLPERFEKQVAFLENNPDIGICGTHAIAFQGKKETHWRHPQHMDDIKIRLLFECCLVHPSVMMRKEWLDQHDLRYDETLGHSEDWELWQRASRLFKLANIPEVLIRYRVHGQSVSRQTLDRQKTAAEKLDDVSLAQLGLQDHPLRAIHRDICYETFNAKNRGAQFLEDVHHWLALIEKANDEYQVYSTNALPQFLRERLFIILTHNTNSWRTAFKIFFNEELQRYVPFTWRMKFIGKLVMAMITGKK